MNDNYTNNLIVNTEPISKILNCLRSAQRHGDRYTALCPAHDDHNPSLSIREANDGRVLLKCHAGCSTESVVGAIGLTMADLFPPKAKTYPAKTKRKGHKNIREIEAIYDYCGENGALLYQAIRFKPKSFSQRRPDGNGGYLWNLDGVKKVPYRLPELLAAESPTVFIPEGEKDVDRLKELGIVATCNPMGAGKWLDDYNEPLRQREVIILPDNDAVGRKHAQQVARALSGIAESVRVLELPDLPESGDVVDWIEEQKEGGLENDEIAERLYVMADNTDLWILDEQQKIDISLDNEFGDEECVKKKETKAARIIKLIEKAELFHTPDKKTFATIPVNLHQETYALKSTQFKQWINREFWLTHQESIHPPAMAEALGALEGKALYDGKEREVYTRIAEHEGKIYLDLCDNHWRVVEIASSGWHVIETKDCPVKFRRMKSMLPLPVPKHGGSVKELRALLNLNEENQPQWVLIISWLIAAFRPNAPYPVLAVHGEQGSAKSTTCRMLRALIDPNAASLRSAPKDEQDLIIAANNSHVSAFDNLSHISDSMSDILCRLSTGGGYARRELYTNDDEVIFDLRRPIILNGITEIITKSDLLDRSILVYLPRITEDRRREESVIWEEFESAKPCILGALLDAVSVALAKLPNTKLEKLPRMADFAKWATAAETGLGLEPGSFLNAYTSNRNDANDLALEASPIAIEIREAFKNQTCWEGSSSNLLELLNRRIEARHENPKTKLGWAKSPKGLTDKLKVLAPNLRSAGFEVIPGRLNGRSHVIIRNLSTPFASSAKDQQMQYLGYGESATKDSKQFEPFTSLGADTANGFHVKDNNYTGLNLREQMPFAGNVNDANEILTFMNEAGFEEVTI